MRIYMSEIQKNDEKPVEIYCPICGFTTPVKQVDDQYTAMNRDEKISYIKMLQRSDHPVFTCSKCDNPEQSADIMEVR